MLHQVKGKGKTLEPATKAQREVQL